MARAQIQDSPRIARLDRGDRCCGVARNPGYSRARYHFAPRIGKGTMSGFAGSVREVGPAMFRRPVHSVLMFAALIIGPQRSVSA